MTRLQSRDEDIDSPSWDDDVTWTISDDGFSAKIFLPHLGPGHDRHTVHYVPARPGQYVRVFSKDEGTEQIFRQGSAEIWDADPQETVERLMISKYGRKRS